MNLRTFLMSIEFFALSAIALTYTIVLGQASGATPAEQASLIAMSFIAVAVGTSVMAWRTKLFLLVLPSSSFLAVGFDAVKLGGLPLLFGMTAFLGVVQGIFSLLIHRLKAVFSPELGFLVLAFLGFVIGGHGLDRYFTAAQRGAPTLELSIGIGCFLLIHFLRELGNNTVRRMAFLAAMLVGYLLTWSFGLMPTSHLEQISAAPWMSLPMIAPGGWSFSWTLAIPTLIAGFVTCIIAMGAVTGLQEAMDPNWDGTHSKTVSRASEAVAAGSLAGALLGSLGMAPSGSAMALSISTRTFNRHIAYWVSLLCVIMAFFSKITTTFIFTPNLVIAAALLYFGEVILLDALKYLSASIRKPRDAFVLYLPLLLGLALQVYPEQVSTIAKAAHLSYGSDLAYVMLFAFFLKAFNRR